MSYTFKGELQVGALNDRLRTGFTKDDLYRVMSDGSLRPNSLGVKAGQFVRWTGSAWTIEDIHYVLPDEISVSVDKAFEGDGKCLVIETTDVYTVGDYYYISGQLYLCESYDGSSAGFSSVSVAEALSKSELAANGFTDDPPKIPITLTQDSGGLVRVQTGDTIIGILVPNFNANNDGSKVLAVKSDGSGLEWITLE